MKTSVEKSPQKHPGSRPRPRRRGLLAAASLLGAALVALALTARPADRPVAQAEPRPLSRIEREAEARFAGSQPYVSLPDGRRVPPANAAHARQMKVKAYQGLLASEAEKRDPTFHLKAEAELKRRRPVQAAITWNDLAGNREMNFTIEDTSACGLDGKTELTLPSEDIARHPCLTQGGDFWDEGTQLTVHLTPVGPADALWAELLYATKKAMATEAHLATGEAAVTP